MASSAFSSRRQFPDISIKFSKSSTVESPLEIGQGFADCAEVFRSPFVLYVQLLRSAFRISISSSDWKKNLPPQLFQAIDSFRFSLSSAIQPLRFLISCRMDFIKLLAAHEFLGSGCRCSSESRFSICPDSSPFMDVGIISSLSFVRTGLLRSGGCWLQIAVWMTSHSCRQISPCLRSFPVNRNVFIHGTFTCGRERSVPRSYQVHEPCGSWEAISISCRNSLARAWACGFPVRFVMDGKIHAHSFGNNCWRQESRTRAAYWSGGISLGNGKHPPPCKLGVPLLLQQLRRIQGVAVCVLQGRRLPGQDFVWTIPRFSG